MAEKPLQVLNKNISKRVIVALRGGREYRGVLDGYDQHMNIVLKGAEEYLNDSLQRKHETTIVRGDSVIFISP